MRTPESTPAGTPPSASPSPWSSLPQGLSQLPTMLRLDVRLQVRSHIYSVSLVLAVLFGLGARYLFSERYAGEFLAAFFLLVIGASTYFVGAMMVLLEKSEGTISALRTSPLLSSSYLASKALSLTGLACAECFLIYAVGFGGAPLVAWPMALGVIVLGLVQTLAGLGQVAPHDAVTSFLIPSAALVSAVAQLPVFYVFEIGPPLLWYAFPTQGPLLLMLAASRPLEPWQWTYALGMSFASLVVAAWWARRRFARHVGLEEER